MCTDPTGNIYGSVKASRCCLFRLGCTWQWCCVTHTVVWKISVFLYLCGVWTCTFTFGCTLYIYMRLKQNRYIEIETKYEPRHCLWLFACKTLCRNVSTQTLFGTVKCVIVGVCGSGFSLSCTVLLRTLSHYYCCYYNCRYTVRMRPYIEVWIKLSLCLTPGWVFILFSQFACCFFSLPLR